MDYTTVTGIEIVKVGTHKAGTGEFTVTAEDLHHMVEAAESGRLPKPVVKIGHVNAAVENPEWGDGAPAYGQLTNLQVSDDETTLLADWVNAPADLVEKLPSAYPHRSMEATFNLVLKDEQGNVAEEYPAVLTGLALLGATPPAVKNLAEVHTAFSDKITGRLVHASGGERVQVAASLPGEMTKQELDDALRAAVRALEVAGDVMWPYLLDWDDEQAFYEIETSTGVSTLRRSYQVDGNQVVWTGDPEQVVARHSFEPVTDTASQVSAGTVPHQHARASDPGATDAAEPVAEPATEGETPMLSEETLQGLRQQLGLPADATAEKVVEAVNTAFEANDTTSGDTGTANADGETPTDDTGQEGDGEAPAAQAPAAQPVAASAPSTVQLSEARLEELLKDYAEMKVQLSDIQAERQATHVDEQIAAAKRAGKISPREEANVRALFSEAPEAAEKFLSNLSPTIPVTEVGTHEAVMASGDDEVARLERQARRELLGLPTDTTESEAR
ncbi:phage protease [Nesterenkonia suensis]